MDERVDPSRGGGSGVPPELIAEIVGADASSIEVERIEVEERVAAQRLAMIAAGRRKGGLLGAAAAGAMIGLRDVYEGPPKDDTIVAVAESPGEPGDIDIDGIEVTVGDVEVWAPPPTRRDDDPGVQPTS